MASPVKIGGRKGPSWTRSGLTGSYSLTGPAGSLPHDPAPLTDRVLRTTSLYDTTSRYNKRDDDVLHLEKIIEFLKTQHADTLNQLHSEIEKLKIENKELNFKLVMCRCSQSSSSSRHDSASPKNNEFSNEIKELRTALHQERCRNKQLIKLIDSRLQNKQVEMVPSSDQESEPSTVEEYRSIINELQLANQQQSHELLQLKADLQDLLYSDKLSPDAYLIARAYIPPNEATRSKLPQIHVVRRGEPIKETAYRRLHESIHLPALKPRPSQLFSERHRRTLSLQRNKLE